MIWVGSDSFVFFYGVCLLRQGCFFCVYIPRALRMMGVTDRMLCSSVIVLPFWMFFPEIMNGT